MISTLLTPLWRHHFYGTTPYQRFLENRLPRSDFVQISTIVHLKVYFLKIVGYYVIPKNDDFITSKMLESFWISSLDFYRKNEKSFENLQKSERWKPIRFWNSSSQIITSLIKKYRCWSFLFCGEFLLKVWANFQPWWKSRTLFSNPSFFFMYRI